MLEGDASALPDLALLRAIVDAHRPAVTLPQQQSSVERWRTQIDELMKHGATATAIFDRLRVEDDAFTGSVSAVKRLVTSIRRGKCVNPNEVVIPVDTLPRKVAQVDFGAVGKLWDPRERRVRAAYVFVMVLGHSRHQFARLVFDQKVETWLALHIEAFEHFGGVPGVIMPDNLKSAVVHAAFDVRDEVALNMSYRELARHFGFQIDPTPPYSPEKKGKVESGVRYVKPNFMKTIGDEPDIDVLNRHLDRWILEIAGCRRHGTTYRQPPEHFETVVRAAKMGDDVSAYVVEVFDSDEVLAQLTKVQAIVRHLDGFPTERANAACRHASYFGSYNHVAIKNILSRGLDLEPLPQVLVPEGGALQGPRFARNFQELLDFTPENNDALN